MVLLLMCLCGELPYRILGITNRSSDVILCFTIHFLSISGFFCDFRLSVFMRVFFYVLSCFPQSKSGEYLDLVRMLMVYSFF